MKKPQAVLVVLLCYVLTASQAMALKGGPPIGGPTGGSQLINTTGTYSGVLTGTTEATATGADNTPPAIPGDPDPSTPGNNVNNTASNALGLFDLTVAQGGLAQGTFLVFSQGRVFRGTISGVADPGTGSLQGVLEASFNFTLQTVNNVGALVSIPITATVVGRLNSTITAPPFLIATTTVPGAAASTVNAQLVTLSGTARLDENFGQVDSSLAPVIDRSINFSVSGFRNTLNNGSILGGGTTGGTGGTGL